MSTILRRRQVEDLVSLSYSTIHRLEKRGEFPQRVQLSANAVGWRRDEIEAWLASRHRGAPPPPAAALEALEEARASRAA